MSGSEENSQHAAAIAGVAHRLRLDAASAEVLELYAGMGVQAALLKGASLVGWLYPNNAAYYTDIDILVCPEDEPSAISGLEQLGFEPVLDDRAMPDWWQEHGSDWFRAQDGVSVDLHRRLVGVRADPTAAWRLLAQDLATATVGGYAVPVLSPPARLLHVTLHAAQHGAGGGGKGRLHLQQALSTFDDELFRAAVDLAAKLDATEAFTAGLRLSPEGAAVADRMGLPVVTSVDAALRATTPPPVALGFEQLAQAGGLRVRLEIGLRKLFPPRAFLEHWDPRAATGRAAYLRARARRPFWVLRSAPAGFRAWWQARRAIQRG
jgi:hypothetical protein